MADVIHMCGIAGVKGTEGSGTVGSMLDVLAHRGPDGRNEWSPGVERGDVIIGHVRLSIIDVEGGKQPILNEDGSVAIVVNGEIYNYKELRHALENKHVFKTGSDSEVVLHLFEEKGMACFDDLDGMYAIAIWNSPDELILARDPLGIKPLYHGSGKDGAFYFASEIKALASNVPEIKELPPGRAWRVGEQARLHYTMPRPRATITRASEAVALVDRTLNNAVRKRLMSDVPLGSFLSGGLDSSLITAMTRTHMDGEELHTFCIGLDGSRDVEHARELARLMDTNHHELLVSERDIIDALPRVIYHLESFDPALVRSSIPTYLVSELASNHVTVVLSGEGADELFAGYRYLDPIAKDGTKLDEELHRITSTLHNTNLQRVDRMTMANKIEGRVPFLDSSMVSLAFSIDPALKHGGTGKHVLRKVAEKYIPFEHAWRTKEKFAIGTGIGPVLERHAGEAIDDDAFRDAMRDAPFPFRTKEQVLYWNIFKQHYDRSDIIDQMGHSKSLNPGQVWEMAT